jgi:hypothetical protein
VDADRQNVGVLGAKRVAGLHDLEEAHVGTDVPAPLADAPVVAGVCVDAEASEVSRVDVAEVDVRPGARDDREGAHAHAAHDRLGAAVAVPGDAGIGRLARVGQKQPSQLELKAERATERQLRGERPLQPEAVFAALRIPEGVRAACLQVPAHGIGDGRASDRAERQQREQRADEYPEPQGCHCRNAAGPGPRKCQGCSPERPARYCLHP